MTANPLAALARAGTAQLAGMTTGKRIVTLYRVVARGAFCRRCGRGLVETELVTLGTVNGIKRVPVCRGCRSFKVLERT